MAGFFCLEQLARFGPQIFGRALSLDGVMGSLSTVSGRHDHIDRHTHEMRQALTALHLLCLLSRSDKESASVLAYTHVVCGAQARLLPETWLAVACVVRYPGRAGGVFGDAKRIRLIGEGLALYTRARAVWAAL